MSESHALVFLKTHDQTSLPEMIWDINQSRRQRLYYSSLILSAPVQGWIRLIIGESGAVDHLLMRNLSGRIATLSFELQRGVLGFAYRLHDSGRTSGAFESNLTFYINQRMQMLSSPRETEMLDLADPVERYVLKRYHEQLHRGSAQTTSQEPIPDDLQDFYAGDARQLLPVLRSGTDPAFVQHLLAPGYNPEAAFVHLVSVLDLPYLLADELGNSEPVELLGTVTRKRADLPDDWLRIPALKT